ncbi:MAG: PQQ-binding-like beta-propeller repeat protein [bacterium]
MITAAASLALAGCSWFSKKEDDDKNSPEGRRISVLTLEEKLEADPRIADLRVEIPRAYTNLAWPQPGGSPTNVLQHVALPDELREVWSVEVGEGSDGRARLTAVPVVADGRIFVLDTRATVRAFDERTGAPLWEVELTPEDERAWVGFGGGVAYDEDRVFVATGFGNVHALDAATGKEVWKRDIGVPIRIAPTALKGRVYVVTTANQINALNAADGLVLWSHQAISESAGVLSATSPAVHGDVVVAPFTSGELIAFRAQNGSQIWSDTLSRAARFTALSGLDDIAGRPVIDNDRVYAVSHSGRMVSIDMRTGERVWTQNIKSIQTPWLAGEFIFLITLDAELLCISARDGRIRWITKMKRYRDKDDKDDPIQWAGPVLAGNRVYVVSSRGQGVAYSPYTGEEIFRFGLEDDAFLPPVVANESLFILTDDGELTAYRASDGKGSLRAAKKRRRDRRSGAIPDRP